MAVRPPLPAALAAEFAYPRPLTVTATEKELEAREKYTIRRIEMPAWVDRVGTNRTITLDYYAPKGVAKAPVILILPMLGGGYDLERYFANYFAKQGLAAVIVHREAKTKEQDTIAYLDRILRQTVLDNKQAIDWIETRPELDAAHIGVFGVSMGGIKGALLTPLEGRVKAAVIGLAGGDLPYIMTHTSEKGLVRRREEYMKTENVTLDELHERLRKCITCDPIIYAPFIDPRKVLLVLASLDTVVPYKKGEELKEKMGNPETITIPAGHYTAVVYIPYIQHQALQFFQERFRPEAKAVNVTAHNATRPRR